MEKVSEILKASETLGFFQMINHGIPVMVSIASASRFNLLELKMELYTRDVRQESEVFVQWRSLHFASSKLNEHDSFFIQRWATELGTINYL